MDKKQRNRLRENLDNYFDEEGLRDLCFHLGADYDNLSGSNKSAKARELIIYLDHQGRLSELLAEAARRRPNATWGEPSQVNKTAIQGSVDAAAEIHFLKYFPDSMGTDFEAAEELWLVGFSLPRNPYVRTIKSKLEKNHIIKVLVVHPDDPAVEVSFQRSLDPLTESVEDKRDEIRNRLEYLCLMREYGPENLQIRTIRFPLSYGAHVMNPESDSGVVYVKLYPFKADAEGQKPKFILRAAYGSWYNLFIDELKALWNAGETWNCKQTGKND